MLESDKYINEVSSYTLCSVGKLRNLVEICKYLNDYNIQGDFVECGTFKGGSAAVISKHLGKTRHLWLYDSFEGMPKTTGKDGEEAKEWIGKCVGAIEDVKEVMNLVSTSEEGYSIKKGWFNQTFCTQLPKQVALLHCDADWYDSVTLVLETFYKLIPDGGCVVLDDFGYWEGCREAFYDFCFRHNEKPLLERVEQDQAYWIKGRSNNRILIATLNTGTFEMSSQHAVAMQPYSKDFYHIQTELEQSQFQLQQTQNKLEHLESQLQQTRKELDILQSQFAKNQAEQEQSQFQLQQAQAEIIAIQSTKFWKLRIAWFRVKKLMGLVNNV